MSYNLLGCVQALSKAHQEIERLESELENVQTAAHTAVETQAPSPHSVPENEGVSPNLVIDPDSKPEPECNMEQDHNGLEQSHNGLEQDQNGLEQDQNGLEWDQDGMEWGQKMEREMERLRQALQESETERCRLAQQVADLQREFDSEEPAPLINTADYCQVSWSLSFQETKLF